MMNLSPRTSPLTFEDAVHLLRRTTFHPTWAAANALVGKSPAQAASALLNAVEPPPTPPDWASNLPEFNNMNEAVRLWPELQSWWANRALTLPSLRERLVWMWHNRFTTDYITVYIAQWMVKQNQVIREKVYDVKGLSTAMIGTPAMLRYLNGDQSIKGKPNENFAREWYELFTLGVGNYTEQDVLETSRAFTGWKISGNDGVYNRQLSDLGEKNILGRVGPWEWADIVRITFEQDAAYHWVALMLEENFVQPVETLSVEDLKPLSDLVRQYDFDLKKVLLELLSSEHFYNEVTRGSLIKSPTQLLIGLASVLNATSLDRGYAIQSMTRLTQEPFYPPTVQGWKGHHAWITSSTFPQRQRFAEGFINGKQTGSSASMLDTAGKPLVPDVVAFVRQLPYSDDAKKVVENVAKLLIPVPTTQEQRDVLLSIMLAGMPIYEWDLDSSGARQRIKFLLQAIVRMPEFQLM